jgi:hypothetical protein
MALTDRDNYVPDKIAIHSKHMAHYWVRQHKLDNGRIKYKCAHCDVVKFVMPRGATWP